MKVGLIGCGKISRAHVNALRDIEGIEIKAVCDRDQQKAQEIASAAGGAHIYDDLAVMLQDETLDAVHVLTPPGTHAHLAVQIMNAGCHVLVEKPMAMNAAEADSMIAAAAENNVKLCVSHNYLYKPSVAKAIELVNSGEIGDVVYINSYYGLAGETGAYASAAGRAHSAWRWRLPGGVFADFLPHLVYMQLAFMPDIERVAGVTMGAEPGVGSEMTEMNILSQGGSVTGNIAISMRAKPYAKFIDVYGTKGIVHADLVREICTVHRNRRMPGAVSKVLFNLEDSLQVASGTAVSTAKFALGRMKSMPGLRELVRQFYKSIETGSALPVTGEDGRKVVAAVQEVLANTPKLPEPQAEVVIKADGPRTDAERRVAEHAGGLGKVLVTGATGFLGQRLIESLARCGTDVVALVRDVKRVPLELEGKATYVRGDITDMDSLEAVMDDVSVVFHGAAITTNNVPWQRHYDVNVKGTENVLQAAIKAGVPHVVHISSVAIYGLDDSKRNGSLAETASYGDDQDKWAYYVRSKSEAERVAFRYSGQISATALRLGLLYGPGAGRPVGRGLIQLGSLRFMIGNGRNSLPFTYVDNAVDCMLLAALTPPEGMKIYNVVDESTISVREAARMDGKIRAEKSTIVPVPPFVLSTVAGFLERRKDRAGSDVPPKLSRYVIRSASRNLKYDTSRVQQELGWKPYVNLEEGLEHAYNN